MPTNQRRIHDVVELGRIVAGTRIAQGLRATELTASHVFVSDLEHGKETAQIGKVLSVLADLGIEVILELPPGVELPDNFDQQPPRRRISR
ncbi:MAG: transcriptional regulator [Betaproteobacteria bacterium HGW-Betaproteobacteria-12]|nr:MAG: transcriptional regulator [Betaproteobacteria bacterium HGW-Betaproteobacteria-12]